MRCNEAGLRQTVPDNGAATAKKQLKWRGGKRTVVAWMGAAVEEAEAVVAPQNREDVTTGAGRRRGEG